MVDGSAGLFHAGYQLLVAIVLFAPRYSFLIPLIIQSTDVSSLLFIYV